MSFSVVILAAGKGTRMYSSLPKVLHTLAGKPMVKHVIDTSVLLGAKNINLVYGHGAQTMQEVLSKEKLVWVEQAEQLGTGHAVQQAASHFTDEDSVLILYGDVPLISQETLERLLEAQPKGGIALLTANLNTGGDYGRIIRKNNKVVAIVEKKDATMEQLKINEINTGILVADAKNLRLWLNQLQNKNAQKEYYLTDIIAFAVAAGEDVVAVHPTDNYEIEGVNNRLQLAQLEKIQQIKQAEKLLKAGVMLRDLNRFDLRGTLEHGLDVEIDVNVLLEGDIKLGDNVFIGNGSNLKNCIIGSNTVIKPNSIIENAIIGENCTVGPFARLRPGAQLANHAHVGNFVELKKTYLGEGSKANHLTYLGDSQIGKNVNIGAGTITCNYDGVNKFKTTIEDNAFIGSDSQLIAPVTIGAGATVGAGSTITRDVIENSLVVTRAKLKQRENWPKPTKKAL